MNKLTIKLSGPPGSGKSTISQAIQEFLKENGFKVSLKDDVDVPYRTSVEQERALNSLKRYTEIDVIAESYMTVSIGRDENGLLCAIHPISKEIIGKD